MDPVSDFIGWLPQVQAVDCVITVANTWSMLRQCFVSLPFASSVRRVTGGGLILPFIKVIIGIKTLIAHIRIHLGTGIQPWSMLKSGSEISVTSSVIPSKICLILPPLITTGFFFITVLD